MTRERYNQLMRNGELIKNTNFKLTNDELKENWHFCPEFDNLLMQNEQRRNKRFYICGYRFPSPKLKPQGFPSDTKL